MTMRVRGENRVLKVVRILIAFIPEVEPGLGVLVNEQRRKGADVADTIVLKLGALPCVPRLCREGMRKGSQAKQVNHHHLAVVIPAIGRKPNSGVQPWGSREVSSDSQLQSTRLKIS